MAIAAKIPMIATTIINSISVKPRCIAFMWINPGVAKLCPGPAGSSTGFMAFLNEETPPEGGEGLFAVAKNTTMSPRLGVAAGRQVLVRHRGHASRTGEGRTTRNHGRTAHPDDVVVGVGIGGQGQGLGADGGRIGLQAVCDRNRTAVARDARHVLAG